MARLMSIATLPIRLVLLTAGTIGLAAAWLVALLETTVLAGLAWYAWHMGALTWVAEVFAGFIG